jgi:hypothetical protein
MSFYESPHFFIYGGISQDQKILHDMFCLNCETLIWKRFFFLEGPIPRLYSGFCEFGDRKFFYGGISLPERLVMNDVWTLSFGKRKRKRDYIVLIVFFMNTEDK